MEHNRNKQLNINVPGRPERMPAPILVSAGVRQQTVLTVGLTAHDEYWLARVDDPQRFRFVPIGDFEQADNPELCRPSAFVAAAVAEAQRMPDAPYGIVAFDDYPASLLAAAIAERLSLPGPSLASTVICSNKVWSRMVQAEAASEAVPRFQAIDPHRIYRPGDLQLAFPLWLKPVKASMSYLGFRVASYPEFQRVLHLAQAKLPAYTAAFQEMMAWTRPSLPAGAPQVQADWLIAEELLSGRQCTLGNLWNQLLLRS